MGQVVRLRRGRMWRELLSGHVRHEHWFRSTIVMKVVMLLYVVMSMFMCSGLHSKATSA